ncbi:hypothetical protein D3C78_1309430 [compost metagenome]
MFDHRARLRRRSPSQRLGELPDATLDQQTAGQLHQILRCNLTHPLALTLLRQALLTTLAQIAVVARSIAFDQITHLRRLRLPERLDRFRCVEPGKEHIADTVFTLLDGELVRAEVA